MPAPRLRDYRLPPFSIIIFFVGGSAVGFHSSVPSVLDFEGAVVGLILAVPSGRL